MKARSASNDMAGAVSSKEAITSEEQMPEAKVIKPYDSDFDQSMGAVNPRAGGEQRPDWVKERTTPFPWEGNGNEAFRTFDPTPPEVAPVTPTPTPPEPALVTTPATTPNEGTKSTEATVTTETPAGDATANDAGAKLPPE